MIPNVPPPERPLRPKFQDERLQDHRWKPTRPPREPSDRPRFNGMKDFRKTYKPVNFHRRDDRVNKEQRFKDHRKRDQRFVRYPYHKQDYRSPVPHDNKPGHVVNSIAPGARKLTKRPDSLDSEEKHTVPRPAPLPVHRVPVHREQGQEPIKLEQEPRKMELKEHKRDFEVPESRESTTLKERSKQLPKEPEEHSKEPKKAEPLIPERKSIEKVPEKVSERVEKVPERMPERVEKVPEKVLERIPQVKHKESTSVPTRVPQPVRDSVRDPVRDSVRDSESQPTRESQPVSAPVRVPTPTNDAKEPTSDVKEPINDVKEPQVTDTKSPHSESKERDSTEPVSTETKGGSTEPVPVESKGVDSTETKSDSVEPKSGEPTEVDSLKTKPQSLEPQSLEPTGSKPIESLLPQEILHRRTLSNQLNQLIASLPGYTPPQHLTTSKTFPSLKIDPAVSQFIRRRQFETLQKTQTRTLEFEKAHAEWSQFAEEMDAESERLANLELKRLDAQAQLQQQHNRHSREEEKPKRRSRDRHHQFGDVARSEAEFLEILANLEAQTARDPLVRARLTSAKIPNQIQHLPTENDMFLSSNNQIVDKSQLYKRLEVDGLDDFTEAEHLKFQQAYLKTPKEFGKIADLVGRNFNDCVRHYYRTKKQYMYKQILAQNGKKKRGRKPKKRVEEELVTSAPGIIPPQAVDTVDKEPSPVVAKRGRKRGRPSPRASYVPHTSHEEHSPGNAHDAHDAHDENNDSVDNTIDFEDHSMTLSPSHIPHLKPDESKSLWTASQVSTFESLLRLHGRKFDLIASEMNVPVNVVKSYFENNARYANYDENDMNSMPTMGLFSPRKKMRIPKSPQQVQPETPQPLQSPQPLQLQSPQVQSPQVHTPQMHTPHTHTPLHTAPASLIHAYSPTPQQEPRRPFFNTKWPGFVPILPLTTIDSPITPLEKFRNQFPVDGFKESSERNR